MSFSLIHDLNNLTAKAADTPAQGRQAGSVCDTCELILKKTKLISNPGLTLFDEVLVEEAVQDGGRYVAVGQQDAGQHGQLVALRLSESL